MDVHKSVAVVTGAGSGLGRGLALNLCNDGAYVIGLGRNASKLEETKKSDTTGRFSYEIADISDFDQVAPVFSKILKEYGRIDILVNNAAIYIKSLFLDADENDFAQTMAINVTGSANCCRLALPSMLENGHGRIILVGSFADKGNLKGSISYGVSKSAIHTLARGLANEIDPALYPDVLVNELIPGVVNTQMSEYNGKNPDQVYPWLKDLINLPSGGLTGKIYSQGKIEEFSIGYKQFIKMKLKKYLK